MPTPFQRLRYLSIILDLNILSQVASQIAIAVDNALDYQQLTESRERLAEERRYLKEELRTEYAFDEIVGEKPGPEPDTEAG